MRGFRRSKCAKLRVRSRVCRFRRHSMCSLSLRRKRHLPRARGSGSRILKRTSHIRIVLSDEIPIETRETKKAKREQEKRDSKKQATASEASERSTTASKTGAKSKNRKKKAKR